METEQDSQPNTPSPWRVVVMTVFPRMFEVICGESVIARALERKLWQCDTINIRDFGIGNYKAIDDVPFGGGAGMVMRADVIAAAVNQAKSVIGGKDNLDKPRYRFIYLSPRGRPLTQAVMRELVKADGLVLLCGRYEGVDQRVLDHYEFEEISLGDFVLSGGEIPAMALIDGCVRLLPGALGSQESLLEESFANNLLEYPLYTRPQLWNDLTVPEVLLSGHHRNISDWRKLKAEEITKERRPDLWQRYKS